MLILEVAESFPRRQLCHFEVTDPLPHPTRLTASLIGNGWHCCDKPGRDGPYHAEKIVRGRRFHMESTVVEADIHHPTDSGLIADIIRSATRSVVLLFIG